MANEEAVVEVEEELRIGDHDIFKQFEHVR